MLSEKTVRRLRTYSRRARASLGGRLKKPCLFMHIPKCGGSSVAEALYATVPFQRRLGVVDAPSTRRAVSIFHSGEDSKLDYHDDLETGPLVYAFREQCLLMHMAWDTELIHGHILFSAKADQVFGRKYGYVTVMRDPMDRVLSNFAHSAHEGIIPSDFDAYLDHYCARIHGLTALRYFAGQHEIAPSEVPAALDLAKTNLAKFDIVGFLDDMEGFCDRFAACFGRRPKVFRYNEARWSKPSLMPHQRARLEQIMAPELEFWEHVQTQRRTSK